MPTLSQRKSAVHSCTQSISYRILKRTFDICLSAALMLLLWPLGLALALMIVLDSDGSAIYAQDRVGLHGRHIRLYKFRSMVKNAGDLIKQFTPEQLAEWQKNFRLEHDPRITKMGAFLRRTGLDELPQLVNIFKGEMSFVGPRPIVEDELLLYGEFRELLLSVKPGLTGYWQVYAAPDCTYAQRIDMDMYYISNAGLRMDARILVKTLSHRG